MRGHLHGSINTGISPFCPYEHLAGGAGFMPLETLGSRYVYQNNWMRVREDRVRWPGGQEDIYGVVEKPNFAVVIPIEDDHVYLVDQYRYPIGRRSLEFPMGADDNNPEASYEAVARSELKEETGMSTGRWTDLGLAYSTCGYATASFRTFVATDLTQGETALEPAEEGLITRRVKLSDFERMILAGEIIDGQSLAAYLLFKLKWA
jgi:8-oxo-dGTP pyrophosphatase MutT (NUDIX family)